METQTKIFDNKLIKSDKKPKPNLYNSNNWIIRVSLEKFTVTFNSFELIERHKNSRDSN